MRRTAVGVIAILLLALAGATSLFDFGSHEMTAACARVGFIMAALWAALPAEGRPVNWWLVGFGLALALGFARLPRPFKIAIVASLPVLLALFWPRKKQPRA